MVVPVVPEPYYSDENVTLYLGDCRDVLPQLDVDPWVTIADPPYGQTSLPWDRWQDGWLEAIRGNSLWCFGSLRMFMDHAAEYAGAGWKLSQDLVWKKHNGSSLHNDRFRRVHEQVAHFYRGEWAAVPREPVYTAGATARTVRTKNKPPHMGDYKGARAYVSFDGGPRLQRSVIEVRSEHHRALHPTQKPIGILLPLIEYAATAHGSTVLDPFAGSGSTLVAARMLGRRAVGIEADEKYAAAAVNRLAQEAMVL